MFLALYINVALTACVFSVEVSNQCAKGRVIHANITVYNGVIHIVDGLLGYVQRHLQLAQWRQPNTVMHAIFMYMYMYVHALFTYMYTLHLDMYATVVEM